MIVKKGSLVKYNAFVWLQVSPFGDLEEFVISRPHSGDEITKPFHVCLLRMPFSPQRTGLVTGWSVLKTGLSYNLGAVHFIPIENHHVLSIQPMKSERKLKEFYVLETDVRRIEK